MPLTKAATRESGRFYVVRFLCEITSHAILQLVDYDTAYLDGLY